MKVKTFIVAAAFVVATPFSLNAQSELSLEQRVLQLEQQAETRRQLQTDMSLKLIDLQKEVKELRGIIEEHDYKLQQIQDRQRDLYRDIESRLSALPKGAAATQTNQTPSTSSTAGQSVVSPSTTSRVKQAVGGDDGRAEFDAAFKLVRNKQYDEAISAFKAFLGKNPTGAFSDNARFWIGQVYFAQSKFDLADEQFALLRAEFPESTKISAAMLKQAQIKALQEKWEEAKALYNEIVSQSTGSTQRLARKGLRDIKQAGH